MFLRVVRVLAKEEEKTSESAIIKHIVRNEDSTRRFRFSK